MNKAELIDVLTDKLGTDRRQATAAVENVVDTIVRAVHKGDSVTITGFGVFEQRRRAARVARNPRTGETVKVKPTSVPAFRPGRSVQGGCLWRTASPGGRPRREAWRQRRHRPKAAAKKAVQEGRGQEGRQEGRGEAGRRRRPPPRRPSAKKAAGEEGCRQEGREEGRAKKAVKKAAGQEGRRRRPPVKKAVQEGAGQEGCRQEGSGQARLPAKKAAGQEGRRPSAAASRFVDRIRRGSRAPAACSRWDCVVTGCRLVAGRPAGCRCGRPPPACRRPATAPTCCPCGCATCPGAPRRARTTSAIRSGITLPWVQITGVPVGLRRSPAPAGARRVGRRRRPPRSASARRGSSTPSSSASGSTVCSQRIRAAAYTSVAPNASSWPTSDSACARPRLSSGRFASSPLYRVLRARRAVPDDQHGVVSAGSLANRRSTFRSCGY